MEVEVLNLDPRVHRKRYVHHSRVYTERHSVLSKSDYKIIPLLRKLNWFCFAVPRLRMD